MIDEDEIEDYQKVYEQDREDQLLEALAFAEDYEFCKWAAEEG